MGCSHMSMYQLPSTYPKLSHSGNELSTVIQKIILASTFQFFLVDLKPFPDQLKSNLLSVFWVYPGSPH